MPTENRSSNTEMVSDILPCPFCKAAMRIESNRDWHRLMGDHDDECVFIDPETMTVPATDEQRAIMVNDWNRRAQPAEKHQGEPVAWRGINELGEVVTDWVDGVPPASMVDLCGNPASFAKIEQAYTHSDPGEVERLARKCENADLALKAQTENCERLRNCLRTEVEAGDSWKREAEDLRAQLAEREALLRSLKNRAVHEWASGKIEDEIDAALSASAEASAPKEIDRAFFKAGQDLLIGVKRIPLQGAPVERDERAEFEKWWSATMNVQEMDLHRHIYPMNRGWAYACHETNRSWMTWQARAALEHKPS